MSMTTLTLAADSETSTLFNPAFCALLLNKARAAYEAKAGETMPITFAFLILPSALHKPTRDALPGTSGSSMWSWLRSNPVILMDFSNRVRTFRPFTGTAIAYGLQHTVLTGSQAHSDRSPQETSGAARVRCIRPLTGRIA